MVRQGRGEALGEGAQDIAATIVGLPPSSSLSQLHANLFSNAANESSNWQQRVRAREREREGGREGNR